MAEQEAGNDSTQIRVPSKVAEEIPERYRVSIVILSGHAEGMEYPIIKSFTTIGRDKTSDIAIQDPLVSRQHVGVQFADGDFSIKDLGSTNGTLLNGKMILESRIRNRDRFQIGDTIIQLIVEDTAGGKVFVLR